MVNQGQFQSGQHCETLLAQRREIDMAAAEGRSPSGRAETARKLLPDFDYPTIALRKALVERYGEVVQEQQYRLLMHGQVIKQIARCRLFAPRPLAGLWWRIRRDGLVAFN